MSTRAAVTRISSAPAETGALGAAITPDKGAFEAVAFSVGSVVMRLNPGLWASHGQHARASGLPGSESL